MDNEKDRSLWGECQSAWKRAKMLQSLSEGDSVLFDVIFDGYQRRWLVNCVDTSEWVTKRFHGGRRAYHPEVWRDE